MKLISNKALRDFAVDHADAAQPLQDFRRKLEKGSYANFAELRAVFPSVDKVGERCVFNIGGNKYRLVAWVQFGRGRVFVKAVLTHSEYDKGKWR
jgi:mRNA interferase HigB